MDALTVNGWRLAPLILLALYSSAAAQRTNGTVANQLSCYTQSTLPAASTAGRLACVSDTQRGVWEDQGAQWVPPLAINPKDFGAKGDGKTAACSMSAASHTLTCPKGSFTAADVGKVIAVEDVGPDQLASDGVTTLHEPLSTVIATYVNSSTVTVTGTSARASAGHAKCCQNQDGTDCVDFAVVGGVESDNCTASADCLDTGRGWCSAGVYAAWGTDDTAAWQAAVDAAADSTITKHVVAPAGRYMVQQIYMPCAEVGSWPGWFNCTHAYNNITISGSGMEATILESWDIDYSVANRVGGMIDAGGWANWPRNDSPKTPLSELHGLTIEDLTVKSVKQARTRQYPLNLAGHQIDVHNVHVMGWSFECVLGGGYGPTLFHHNVVESCNKPGKIVAGGGALNLNGSRSTADHNRINAVNWGGETASSITTFDANEIVCRKPGATGFTIGSSVSGLFQISFTNNVIRNCATALQSGNGQGVQTEIAIVSNLFDRTGSVTLLGGLESSALTYGYRSPVAHFPATIKGNTWVDPPGGAIQIGGTAQQYGLDPVSIADNTVIYARNYCVGGPHAGSACQFAVADCGSSSETSPEYPCQVAGPALYVYGFGGATLWQPSTAYAVGGAWNGYVVPVFDNGHVYRVTVAGTSASREPTWPTDGTTVTSGGATFIDAGPRPWVDVNNFRLVGMTDGIRASNQGMIRFGTNGLLNNNPHVHLRNVSASFDWHLTSDGTAMLNGEGFTEWIPAGFALSDDRITRAELDLKYSCPHNSTYCDAVASFLPYGTAGLGFTQTKLPSSTPNLPTTITITRAGQIAPAFAGSTAYAFGALVRATTDNGHVYKVTVTGTSSSEPSWCTSTGCTSTSGGVTFQETGTSAKWQ